uniref:Mitochondrial glycoprotein n=1 Tax=Neobodo designis TaxID=312471 RepID=A0A7S1M9B5_NEODS
MFRVASRIAARPVAAAASAAALRVAQPVFAAPAFAAVRHASRLSAAAKEELDDELSNERVMPQLPEGWTVQHKKGESRFTMTKKHGDEQLSIICQLQVLDPEVAERRANGDAADAVEHFPFTLHIVRGGKCLDFSLTHADGELVIDGMTHYESAAVAQDDSAEGEVRKERHYQGPTFAELNSGFVDAIVDYLEARGVNDDLSTFVAQYSYAIEQQEYENWLRAVADFTA